MTLRVVLDTNVVVSALLFQGGRMSWIRTGWMSGAFTPLVSTATTTELLRVLAYPKFSLEPHEVEALLSEYLPFTEIVEVSEGAARELPESSDPDDRIFLALREASGADFLVSGDRALQAAGAVSPDEFRHRTGHGSTTREPPE